LPSPTPEKPIEAIAKLREFKTLSGPSVAGQRRLCLWTPAKLELAFTKALNTGQETSKQSAL
jgi:hypothetical protein